MRETRKSRLHARLQGISFVDEALFETLRTELAPVSDGYLRDLLRDSGIPLAPVVEGVNARSLDDLQRTLEALGDLYEAGRRDIRPLVIEAKDRIRFAAVRTKDPARAALREEEVLWLLTWLENPAAFPVWAGLRRKVIASGA